MAAGCHASRTGAKPCQLSWLSILGFIGEYRGILFFFLPQCQSKTPVQYELIAEFKLHCGNLQVGRLRWYQIPNHCAKVDSFDFLKDKTMKMRHNFPADFKARVALDALPCAFTMTELANKHSLHPNLISQRKRKAHEGLPDVFAEKNEQQAGTL